MPDVSSPAAAKNIMQQYGLFPKKRLGQNFLIDRNVLIKIAESCNITSEQYFVEIGPGLGSLTQELAIRSQGVLAIEVDTGLEPVLEELAVKKNNVRILFRDILKVDIESEIERTFGLQEVPPYQVCANIPYNITTPIIFQLLENCPNMQAATLMMQKEVGERLLAKPGSKEYGRLTITAAYYANIKHILNVSSTCFYPRPDVDSVVLRITPQRPKTIVVKSEDVFKDLIRVAFQKRRKTILNIISTYFGLEKYKTEEKLREIGLGANLRPENLSIQEVATLVNAFTS
jgi:16S rRNA (adenine1518-N6/adenine1519-N6)-dimethyltransferase